MSIEKKPIKKRKRFYFSVIRIDNCAREAIEEKIFDEKKLEFFCKKFLRKKGYKFSRIEIKIFASYVYGRIDFLKRMNQIK